MMPLNIDLIYQEIGELGPQQKRYCFGLFLFNIYGAWHMLQYTFVGYSLDFECFTSSGTSTYHSQCPSQSVSNCIKVEYPTLEKESTIVSEWDLICDRGWRGPLTMSIFMAGVMTGALLLGSVADKFGRRKTLGLCLSVMIVMNGISAVTANLYVYASLKYADGVFCGGYILSSFVLCNELIGSSKRGVVGNAIQAFFAIGIMTYSLMAYYVRHWRSLTALTSVLGLPLLLIVLHLPESPRWLQSKGRVREALIVLREMATKNGRNLDERTISSSKEDIDGDEKEDEDEDTASLIVASGESILDLLNHSVLINLTVIQIYSWFVNSATYYGLTLAASASASSRPNDRYMSTALSGAVEIPAYILASFLLTFQGRRWTTSCFMISGGSALLSLVVLSKIPGIINCLSLFCKLCISASFAVIYIHSSEIFPTTIRNTAMGLVSVAARMGGILAPFLAQLGDYGENLHLFVFGGMTLTAGILNLYLPETREMSLPETVGDLIQNITKEKSLTKKAKSHNSVSGYKKLRTEDI